MKIKWTKNYIVFLLGNDNAEANAYSKNIILTIKNTKLYVSVNTVSAKDLLISKTYSSFLEKDLMHQRIKINIK